MIPIEALAAATGLDGLFAFLREAGWSVAPSPVDLEAWRAAGVAVPSGAGARVAHAARDGHLDLYVADGPRSRELAAVVAAELNRRNCIVRSYALAAENGTVSFCGPDREGAIRRLDLERTRPRAAIRERLGALVRRPGRDAISIQGDLERALEREALTREFFVRFRDRVREVEAHLARAFPEEAADSIAAQALLLLSRILFLYFIQSKGWLDRNPAFLVDLTSQRTRPRIGLYSGLFQPLFFGCLNTPASKRDPFARRLGAIPYLNGGLFEPSPFERRNPVVPFDDSLLERILFETFERFAFTTDEEDGEGTHVDPEMLGRVFECLMESDERLASGSFYTPRPVVDTLVRDGILLWAAEGDRSLSERLERWLAGDGADLEPVPARRLMRRIQSIRILDPACGSGAFLLSALHLLTRLERRLCRPARRSERPALRRQIVARALHGIDLKPEAVRLCELRLWLAIVSGEGEEPAAVDPLPNLDRNVLQGNALLSPLDFLSAGRLDVYRDWALALRARSETVERYRAASPAARPALMRRLRASDLAMAEALVSRSIEEDRRELERLRGQGDLFGSGRAGGAKRRGELEARIGRARQMREDIGRGELSFFAAELAFAHVLERGGFDLVVGNPPWVRSSRIAPDLRLQLADRFASFASKEGGHQPDLSVAFLERALQLAAPGAVVGQLVPAKLATARYARPLRRLLTRRLAVRKLYDWSDGARKMFQADTFPLGIVGLRDVPPTSVDVVSSGESFTVKQRALAKSSGAAWVLAPPDVTRILNRCEREASTLADFAGPAFMGLKSGANESLLFDDAEVTVVDEGVWLERLALFLPHEAVVRCLRGRDVRRWRATPSSWLLRPRPGEPWTRLLEERGVHERLPFPRAGQAGAKVVWRDVSRRMDAAVVEGEWGGEGRSFPLVPNQTTYFVAAGDGETAWAVAGLLNSQAAGAWLVARADRAKDGHFRYFGRTVQELPVPRGLDRAALAAAARAAAEGTARRGALDALVGTLYGLSPAERKILEAFHVRRTGSRS